MKLKKLGFMNIKREDILSRNEMKSLLAGSGAGGSGFRRCGCNYNDALLGFVHCSDDINSLVCCRVHYPSTQTTSCP